MSYDLLCEKKRPEVFESWEEEEYFPGEPRIPLGSYKYNKVCELYRLDMIAIIQSSETIDSISGKKGL